MQQQVRISRLMPPRQRAWGLGVVSIILGLLGVAVFFVTPLQLTLAGFGLLLGGVGWIVAWKNEVPGRMAIAGGGADPGPTVNAGPAQTIQLPLAVALHGSVDESVLPLGGQLTSRWTAVSGPGAVTFASATSASTTAMFSVPGNYVLQLDGSDGTVTHVSQLIVTVLPDPGPTVSAGHGQTVNFPTPVQLLGSVEEDSLPPAITLTSSWTKLSGPGAVTFVNSTSASTSATFWAPGHYVLQLSGTDGTTTNQSQLSITVNPDPGPSVNAGVNQSITLPFDSVELGGTASENIPFGGAVTYTWSEIAGPDNVAFANATSNRTEAEIARPGLYVLQLAASDGITTNVSTMAVNVSPDPGPLVSAGPNQTLTLPTTTAVLAGSVNESPLPEGITLTSTWAQVSGPAIITFANPTRLTTTATFPGVGVYVLELIGGDGITTTTSKSTITVNLGASIHGQVMSALNGSPIAGRAVYIDANHDGQLDNGEAQTITDASGNFAFDNLPAADYRIFQLLPPGAVSADPSSGFHDVTVVPGQTLSGISFANLPTPLAGGPAFVTTILKQTPLSSGLAGGQGTAVIKVTNVGAASPGGRQTLTVMASLSGDFSTGNRVLVNVSLGALNLKHNASRKFTVRFRYPADLARGSYTLLAVPDSSNSVPQLSFNVSASGSARIAPHSGHRPGVARRSSPHAGEMNRDAGDEQGRG